MNSKIKNIYLGQAIGDARYTLPLLISNLKILNKYKKLTGYILFSDKNPH